MFNYKYVVRYVLLGLMFSQLAYAEGNNNNEYALPPSKHYMELCLHEALQLHAGVVEKERVFHQQGGFWVRYDIQANDHSEWEVLCDLTTGKIVREQKQLD